MAIHLLAQIANLLRDKRKTDTSSETERIALDFQIIAQKPIFSDVVHTIQRKMFQMIISEKRDYGQFVELGAGAMPLRNLFPQIRATDVIAAAHLDGVLDATNLDVSDESLDGIFLQNTFHHIPDPKAFFNEALRVLRVGGRIVIIDPYWNQFSSLLYPNLFKTEGFDKEGNWNDASGHAMIGANQALSYVVFERDLDLFVREFSNLGILHTQPLKQGFRYLLSGGLNFSRIAPKFVFRWFEVHEEQIPFLNRLAIHWMVVIEKTA